MLLVLAWLTAVAGPHQNTGPVPDNPDTATIQWVADAPATTAQIAQSLYKPDAWRICGFVTLPSHPTPSLMAAYGNPQALARSRLS